MGVFDAALGDLHVSQPMVLGTWQSRMSLAQTAAAALMPMLSSYLAGLDLRLPFIVSAGRHSVLLPILLRSYSYDDIVYTSCRQQSI
jgi:hypothetical protein